MSTAEPFQRDYETFKGTFFYFFNEGFNYFVERKYVAVAVDHYLFVGAFSKCRSIMRINPRLLYIIFWFLAHLTIEVVLLSDFIVEGTGSREVKTHALLSSALFLTIRQVE